MRFTLRPAGWAAALAAAALAPAAVRAQQTTTTTTQPAATTTTTQPATTTTQPATTATTTRRTAAPVVVGSHQIDRFAAIRQLQEGLKTDPKNERDWVILGELAHEVALDQPADQARPYYDLSRQAYEKALELDPDSASLKAAVQFARDQEQGIDAFEQGRQSAVAAYLAARRRELESNLVPTVPVYNPPTPTLSALSTAPEPALAPATNPRGVPEGRATVAPAAPAGIRPSAYEEPYYPYPVYQPFAPGTGQPPLTYEAYRQTYLPPTITTVNPAAPPMTLRQYTRQLVGGAIRQATGVPATAVPAPAPAVAPAVPVPPR